MSLRRILVAFTILLTTSAYATDPVAADTTPSPLPCDNCIIGVDNFYQVSPVLWRGAQPSAEGFKALAAAGVKTIINLRTYHDDLPLLDGTQLHYVSIPMDAWHPDEKDLMLFLRAVQQASSDPSRYPIFVHCQQGRDRTGYSVATYRMVMQNWSAADAIKEMYAFRFNRIWVGNPRFLKHLDVEDMKKQLTIDE